jgi:tRNA dimethylallyltransferase
MPCRLLVIAGPTGVGKTATAVALARRLPLEVVSADSRQVYCGMDVATGKPTPEERRAVRHHLVDILDPDERYHAARFAAEARATIETISARGRLPVVVGGTGLYIRALLRGLDPGIPADPEFRRELASIATREGRAALHARLERQAPAMAQRLHPNDQVRVIRALELLRHGGPVATEQVRWRIPHHDGEGVLYVGLTIPRPRLAARLRARARAMVEAGLLGEVQALLARGYDETLTAMQGIGYREFARVARGELDEPEALRLMERDTIRYAKRQWTWFAREPGIHWIDVEEVAGPAGAAEEVERMINNR